MTRNEGLLVLVRHGQSTDNELNLYSGWRDPELTAHGEAEARRVGAGLAAQGLTFDAAFTSRLRRAQRTLELVLEEMRHPDLSVVADEALNERHYGELAGLNKEQSRSVFGSDQVHLWRKSYHAVPPGGESLAMTAARTLPFFEAHITPRLRRGERVLVVAHGNSLRSLVKLLDGLSDEAIITFNIATCEILTYGMDAGGNITKKVSAAA